MGQKVNPIGLRLGINRTWDSRWFANKAEYGQLLHEDMKIREVLMTGTFELCTDFFCQLRTAVCECCLDLLFLVRR